MTEQQQQALTARQKRRANLPPAPKSEPTKPRQVCAIMNQNNPLKAGWPGITFLYEIDGTAKGAKDEELILEHNEYDWEDIVKIKDLKEVSPNWIRLLFKCGPRKGHYNLLQDPKDGEEPFFVFYKVPFEDLKVVLPECEENDAEKDA